MSVAQKRMNERRRRGERIRKKILGTTERPRLCVRRSLTNMYAQIIDDINGISIVQVSSTSKALCEKNKELSKVEMAKFIGEQLAVMAREKGIESVVFDRKGYLYHGRVKALADGARSKGLKF